MSDLTKAGAAFILAEEALTLTQFYDDLGIYSLKDLKLWAPIRDKESISRRLLKNGWDPIDEHTGLTFCRKEKVSAVRIYWLDDAEFEEAIKDAAKVLVNGSARSILCLEEQLVGLCELEFIDFREVESRWQFVAFEILNRGILDPVRLQSAARRRGVSRPLADMLQALKDDLAVEISDASISELRSASPITWASAKRKCQSLRRSYKVAHDSSGVSFRQFLAQRWNADSNAMLIKHAVESGIKFLRSK
ncbi:MAG: hypothetical protein DMF63_16310 [Acidobacteria bacterium]|nr:MAG: hypothetical protein DMF63_16310 [Acidobacteriota bacterium]